MRLFYGLMVALLAVNFAQAADVTFNVNMRVQALKGSFNPAEDLVYVRGPKGDWGTTYPMTDGNGDSVYSATITDMTSGNNESFKYFFTAPDTWENDPNRSYVVPEGGGSFTAYFNNDSVYAPQLEFSITFECDMELERLSGRFNPETQTVMVRGDFNGWGQDDTLTQSTLNPDVYEKTRTVTRAVGENIQYKFYYSPDSWESGGNYSHTFTGDEATNGAVEARSFNNASLNDVLNQEATIKFRVVTAGAKSAITSNPFPVVNSVWMAGSTPPLRWPDGGWPHGDSTKVLKFSDDGTNGDEVAGDGIFSRDVTFPPYTVLSVEYKYNINWGDEANYEGGNDNESGFAQNHSVRMFKFQSSGTVTDTFGVTKTSVAGTVNPLWNMLSLPVSVSNGDRTTLFPGSTSDAFKYTGTYEVETTLQPNVGYWLKFGAEATIAVSGDARDEATVTLSDGWNMIGTLSSSIEVSGLTGGNISGSFFEYDAGYRIAEWLDPLKAYWVKSNGGGDLILSTGAAMPKNSPANNLLQNAGSLTVRDADASSSSLYFGVADHSASILSKFELPPAPPAGVFDVRYGSGKMAEFANGAVREIPVLISSASYPVTISWDAKNSSTASLRVNGVVRQISGKGSVSIEHADVSVSLILGGVSVPTAFALHQNYPNPFNPSTRMQIDLPVDAMTSVVIYSMLGEEVATVFNGQLTAGRHELQWNGTTGSGIALPSGIYVARMLSGEFSSSVKMMLVK